VVNGKTELGLGALVLDGSSLGAGKVKSNLGLLGEFLGKVLDKEVVKLATTELVVAQLGKDSVLALIDGNDRDRQRSLSHVENNNLLVTGLKLASVALLGDTKETTLSALLGQTSAVTGKDGSGLVKDLDNVDAGGRSSVLESLGLVGGEPSRGRDDTVGGLLTKVVGSRAEEVLEEESGDLGDGDGLLGGGRLTDGGGSGARRSSRARAGGRERRRGDHNVNSVGGDLGLGDEGSGKDGGVVNLVVSVAKEVTEAHDGVVAILDELGLGTVADVLRVQSVNCCLC
jgi:hypothetical protein